MNAVYRIFDPTGNITALVETPVDAARQAAIAARLMDAEPQVEQVGFLSQTGDAVISLRMAGGEFCGNATMCAAVTACEVARQDAGSFQVRVSGAQAPVNAEVALQPDGSWRAVVDMPRPAVLERRMLPGVGEAPVVRFDGITHIVLTEPMPRPLAERQARAWCQDLGADALGLMFLDLRAGRMTPLVYVPAAGTLCWESSCASGTTAVGAYLAAEQGRRVTAALRQPAGLLTIEADETTLRLTGTVRIGERKEIEI